MADVRRMRSIDVRTNPVEGQVIWSPVKSLWYSTMAIAGIVGAALTRSPLSWLAYLTS